MLGSARDSTPHEGETGRDDERAALRRLLTLLAAGGTPAEVFAAVAEEVAALIDVPTVVVGRYDDAGSTLAVVGARSDDLARCGPGTRLPIAGASIIARTLETGRPVRTADVADHSGMPHATPGAGTAVCAPIEVAGRVWGAIATSSPDRPLPPGTEDRLGEFTALAAIAISNAQADEDLRRLAEEQAALRRVATLVARQPSPDEVFAAVAEEAAKVLGVDTAGMFRYEADGTATITADWGNSPSPVGVRLRMEGESVSAIVLRTRRAARIDDYATATGSVAAYARQLGVRASVGAPIVVDGKLWGAMVASSRSAGALPPDTEVRIGQFTDLVATAISNIQARTDLAASRARILEAADDERRQLVRDLHDSAQSRLVYSLIALERARARDDMPHDGRALIQEGLAHVRCAIDELRELAHGIHPAILTNSGLGAAVDVLAGRAPMPVEVRIAEERYPGRVESAAYFVTAEALTNVVKYARASMVRVEATRTSTGLRLVIEDDGVGGAHHAPGRGLAGLRDRLAALDGDLVIASPAGRGTRIMAEIPLPGPPGVVTG